MTATLAGHVTIRNAAVRDVPWLLEEARQFADYYGMQWLIPASPEAFAAKMTELVEHFPFFIADRDGSRIGFLVAAVSPHFFNPDVVVATELLWWVTPTYRGTSAGARLLAAFEQYTELRAHGEVLALPPQCLVDAATLEKRGYRLMESSYLRMRTAPVAA